MKPKQRKKFIQEKGKRHISESDRNFDDLAHKFSKKVYGELKGKIRLEILKKDLAQFIPNIFSKPNPEPLSVLDAGAGYGPFSLYLAEWGHDITLVDHSSKMLDIAAQQIKTLDLESNTRIVHAAIQQYLNTAQKPLDLILCHAVIEWVKEPESLIENLVSHLNPEGFLSLTFYNLHGMVFKNLLRTNYKKILKKEFYGWPGSLTPTYPLTADRVLSWMTGLPVVLLCHSGMRVFHDYILDLKDKEKSPETVIQLEKEYSRISPYRDMGRYQHLLFQKQG